MTTGYRYAMQSWVSNGVRVNYDFSFDGGYLASTDIKAYREPWNGTAATGPREDLTVSFIANNPADGATATVRVAVGAGNPATPQPNGYRIVVYRSTEKGVPLVDFQNGAVLTGGNLNTAVKQAIFSGAEIADQFAAFDDGFQVQLDDFYGRLDDVEDLAADAAADAATAITSAAAANSTASAAATAAAAASAAASSATVTANTASASVAVAITAAQEATDSAEAATAALDGIIDEVNGAVTAANSAVVTANAASAAAAGIADDATNALNTANAIDAKAQSALDNSAVALDAANDAVTAADNATTTANAASAAVAGKADTSTVNTALALKADKAGPIFSGVVGVGSQSGGGVGDLRVENASGARIGWTHTSTKRYTAGNAASGAWTLRDETAAADRISVSTAGVVLLNGQTPWTGANFTPGNYAPLAGAAFTGATSFANGVNFGAQVVTGADLSKHLTLHTSGYGLNVISGTIQMIFAAAVKQNWTATGSALTGAMTATGGFQSTSSRKVKTALKPIRNALAALDGMELVTGKYRRDFHKHDGRKFFAIADTAPAELVVRDVAEYKGEKVDGLDYDGLAVLSAAAIRELLTIVQDQQRQIDELKEML